MPKQTQSKSAIAQSPTINDAIHTIRGQKVILRPINTGRSRSQIVTLKRKQKMVQEIADG